MKTKYRILHHGLRSWLQFESKSGWRYINNNATTEYDCPKSLCWKIIPSFNYLNADSDDFFEMWTKAFPDIQDYFNRSKETLKYREDYQNKITYL